MKIAIVHYWFLTPGGGEKVTEHLATLFPESDVFCLFADLKRLPPGISKSQVHVSFLNKLPFSHRANRALFPLYSAAAGSFNLSEYDLIISSDSPPTKGIVTSSEAVHISYCHTPGRFIWDMAAAFTAKLPWLARPLFAHMASSARTADYVAAQRVDHFLANSNYVARRIRKYYGRNATVLYPPVNVEKGYISETHDSYYLSVGRLIKNKRLDILIQCCNKLKRRLVIVGEGRDESSLRAIAGPTVEFTGPVSGDELARLYARSRAFLFAADEDFGIVSVEAQSYGRPVIAYGHGGSLESVRVNDREGRSDTGVFFHEQTPASLEKAILKFESRENEFFPDQIREHSRKFDAAIFREKLIDFVGRAMVAKEMGSIQTRHTSGEIVPGVWDGVTERRTPRPAKWRRHDEPIPISYEDGAIEDIRRLPHLVRSKSAVSGNTDA
jgi:glycosyltransferase involved in cell wall biosynthesis